MTEAKIAILGDLHGSWDDRDADYFNQSDYDLLLFTGDIGSGTLDNGIKVARSIARLSKPALVMPGNNDVANHPEIAAEFAHQRGLIGILRAGNVDRSPVLSDASGRVELCGYSVHCLHVDEADWMLLAGRPHSMGGPDLTFAEQLARNHGIDSIEESAKRLTELFDGSDRADWIVLSHNGPFGLGHDPTDMWGCDFMDGGGDWGDPDLAAALRHAEATGKRVHAVIAGHMHLRTSGGHERPSQLDRDGTLFVNPARVPRVFPGEQETIRSHFRLEWTSGGVAVSEVRVPFG